MPPTDDEQTLGLTLGASIYGLGDLDAYAAHLDKVAEREQVVARRARASSRALSELNKVRKDAAEISASSGTSNSDPSEYLRIEAGIARRSGVGQLRQYEASAGFSSGTKVFIDEGAIGPRERLKRINGQIERARANGADSDRLKDLDDARSRAQRAIDKADAPPVPEESRKPKIPSWVGKREPDGMDKITDALMTSRFSVGANGGIEIMPLINRTLRAGLGPWMLVGEAAELAATRLKAMGDQAQKTTQSLSAGIVNTGGNANSAIAALTMGKVGGADIGADADRLYAAAHGGGMGSYWAVRLGLNLRPDVPGRPVDRAKMAIDAITKMHEMRASGKMSDEEESQALRELGMADARLLVDASPARWKQAQSVLERARWQNNPAARKLSDDQKLSELLSEAAKEQADNTSGTAANKFRTWWRDLWFKQDSQPSLKDQIDKRYYSQHPEEMSKGSAFGTDSIDKQIDQLFSKSKSSSSRRPSSPRADVPAIDSDAPRSTKGSSSADRLDLALMMLVSALSQNTDALTARGALMGGGERARSAIPDRLPGYVMANADTLRSLRLGAL